MTERGLVLRAIAGAAAIGLLVAILGAAVWIAVAGDGDEISRRSPTATGTASPTPSLLAQASASPSVPGSGSGAESSAAGSPSASAVDGSPPSSPSSGTRVLEAVTALGRSSVVSSATSPFADCNAGGSGTATTNSEVEPQIAIDPRGGAIVAAWQQDRWSNGAARGIVAAVSTDRGTTWSRSTPGFSVCADPARTLPARVSDPWVAFGPDGVGYLAGLAVTPPGETSVSVARSTDGGTTWSSPATVIHTTNGRQFNDKESVTADPARPGTAYLVWDQNSGGESESDQGGSRAGTVLFAATDDGGRTWSDPASITSVPGTPVGNVIAITPDGTLVDVFLLVSSDRGQPARLVALRSADRGGTWSAGVTIASFDPGGVLGGQPPGVRGGGGLPSIAADTTGTVRVAWVDGRGASSRLALASSDDGGRTWSEPTALPRPADVPVFLPSITIAPDGAIGVEYTDLRPATADQPFLADRFLAVSRDGGGTWRERRLTDTFDLSTAPNAGGRFLGDYSGLAATKDAFVSAFAMTTGDTANPTDLVVRVDPLDDPAALRRP